MLFTATLITGGACYVGTKKYKEHQKRKKMPWTYYAERMERRQLAKRRLDAKQTWPPIGQAVSSSVASAKLIWHESKFDPIRRGPLFHDPRRQQLKEISEALDESETSEADKRLNRDLTISALSLTLATAGPLIYSPLSLLSVPGLLWITIVNWEDAYQSFKAGRGINIYTLSALFSSGTILTGSYFAGNLGAFFVRLSKKLLSKTKDNSIQSLINVFGHQTRFVSLLKDGIEVETTVDTLRFGDLIVVHAGETIAVDGKITAGTATIDERVLTGESQPTQKEVGHKVLASTVVLSGKILIEVEKAGQDTLAARIGEILNQTKDFKNEILSWGEDISDRSARTTIVLSALLLPFAGATTALTVLTASFGIYMMALGPISTLSFLNLAGHAGILVKDGRSLQLLTDIDTVVFDKTGTLTKDYPHIGYIHTLNGVSEGELLTVAAAAEYKQTHPIARAIREAASLRGLALPEINSAHVEIGYGLKVKIPTSTLSRQVAFRRAHFASGRGVTEERDTARFANTSVIRVGSERFMELEGIVIPSHIQQVAKVCQQNGDSLVYVAINNQLAGAIELHATIRSEAKEVINQLRKRKMEIYIISGDHEQPTRKLAQELGIDHYFAQTLPENKANLIAKLQEEGKSVCFVGDGINDSIALKKANVSVSLRGASSVATDAAQMVLMNKNLTQLIQAFDIAQNYEQNMKFNIITTTLPGIITVFGALFLKFGVLHALALNYTGAIIGASHTVWPWLKEQRLHRTSGLESATWPSTRNLEDPQIYYQ